MVDDLIATGGTLEAGVKLIEHLGGELAGITVLIELRGLDGVKRIATTIRSMPFCAIDFQL